MEKWFWFRDLGIQLLKEHDEASLMVVLLHTGNYLLMTVSRSRNFKVEYKFKIRKGILYDDY